MVNLDFCCCVCVRLKTAQSVQLINLRLFFQPEKKRLKDTKDPDHLSRHDPTNLDPV